MKENIRDILKFKIDDIGIKYEITFDGKIIFNKNNIFVLERSGDYLLINGNSKEFLSDDRKTNILSIAQRLSK